MIAQHEGERTVEAFEETAKRARVFLDTRKKAGAGDPQAQYECLSAQLAMQYIPVEEVQKRLAGLAALTAQQKESIQPLVVRNEIRKVTQETLRPKMASPEARIDAGRQFFEMLQAQRLPPAGMSPETQTFWVCILAHAESRKDAATFARGLEAIKGFAAGNPQAQGFIAEQEKKLAAMREAGQDAPK